jgi:putative transposase
MCYPIPHAKLSSRACPGRLLLLHCQPAGAAANPARGPDRRLREAVATTRRHHPFSIDAFVVLPDHLHAVWTPPPGDNDYSTRWRLIKSRFAKGLPKQERLSAVRKARGERGIFQRRFWEHLIRDEADYARHIEYCYINPLKHRLVARVRDWPYSSFHRDVRAGLFPVDWGGDAETIGEFGER